MIKKVIFILLFQKIQEQNLKKNYQQYIKFKLIVEFNSTLRTWQLWNVTIINTEHLISISN